MRLIIYWFVFYILFIMLNFILFNKKSYLLKFIVEIVLDVIHDQYLSIRFSDWAIIWSHMESKLSPFQSTSFFILVHPTEWTVVLRCLLYLFKRIICVEYIVVTLLLVLLFLLSLRAIQWLLLWFWSKTKAFIWLVQYFICHFNLFTIR